jgi:hypothetical protein
MFEDAAPNFDFNQLFPADEPDSDWIHTVIINHERMHVAAIDAPSQVVLLRSDPLVPEPRALTETQLNTLANFTPNQEFDIQAAGKLFFDSAALIDYGYGAVKVASPRYYARYQLNAGEPNLYKNFVNFVYGMSFRSEGELRARFWIPGTLDTPWNRMKVLAEVFRVYQPVSKRALVESFTDRLFGLPDDQEVRVPSGLPGNMESGYGELHFLAEYLTTLVVNDTGVLMEPCVRKCVEYIRSLIPLGFGSKTTRATEAIRSLLFLPTFNHHTPELYKLIRAMRTYHRVGESVPGVIQRVPTAKDFPVLAVAEA